MGSCRSLEFKPNFKVSTSAHTSRLNGASLDAKILYPTAPLGDNQATSQASIASVKVELPKVLPSRLTTLQKACLAKVFEENPANHLTPAAKRTRYAQQDACDGTVGRARRSGCSAAVGSRRLGAHK